MGALHHATIATTSRLGRQAIVFRRVNPHCIIRGTTNVFFAIPAATVATELQATIV